jgi:capsular exopolysaccharide synthesis family protein
MSEIFEALQQSNVIKSKTGLPILDMLAPSLPEVPEVGEAPSLDDVVSSEVSSPPSAHLVALTDERGLGAEKIRILASKLSQLQKRKPVKKLLISSSVKAEGKSLISSNLALTLAKTQQRVLLIDGDCHQPSLSNLLGIRGAFGLSGWWQSKEPITRYLRKANAFPLWFLAAGEPMEHSLEMLQSERFAEQLNQLAGWFDWVIIDSPPLAPLADSSVWTSLADALILIVRKGITPKKVLANVLDGLDKPKLLGIVLNDIADPHIRYYSHYYRSQAASS